MTASTRRGYLLAVAGLVLAILRPTLASGAPEVPTRTLVGPVEHLVVLVVPDLRWDDVDLARAGHLRRWLDGAAIGSVSLHGIREMPTYTDGLATASAGARALGIGPQCRGVDGLVRCAGQSATLQRNAHEHYGAVPGEVGAALSRAGVQRFVVGEANPVAFLLTASDSGVAAASDLGAVLGDPRRSVVVLEGPSFRDGASPGRTAALDDEVGVVQRALGPHDALLLVSLSYRSGPAHLGVIALSGPGVPATRLRSASTDRTGVVETADVGASIVDRMGISVPSAMEGSPVFATGATAPTIERVRDARALDAAAVERDRMLGPASFVLALAPVAVCVLGALVRRRPWFFVPALVAGAFPVSTYIVAHLVDTDAGQLRYWSTCAAISGLLALGGLAATRVRCGIHASVVVAATTAFVLSGDLLTGSRLQYNAVFGYSATAGGRFVGAGNYTTGFLVASVLVVLLVFARTVPGLRHQIPVIVVWCIAIGVVGAPRWGADVGGVLALVPTAALCCCLLAGVRLRPRVVLGTIAAAVVAVGVFAAVDLARPPSARTHLGRLVSGTGAHGTSKLLDMITRKANMALHSVVGSVWGWALPLLALVVWWFVRSRRTEVAASWAAHDASRAIALSTVSFVVLGSLLNDSGLAVAGAVAGVSVPLIVALVRP